MQYFVPLAKIDEEKRLVYGIGAMEQADRSKEIMDYATAKPVFAEWSARFSDATGGMSKGNVRVMHNPKVVAGKLTEMTFDDDAKAVHVCAKIVDDNEWKKALEGCYTGFSIGGSYLKKWKDGDLTRYTPNIAEISMVDSPCIPGARIIELQKADGTVQEIMATGRVPRTYAQLVPPPTYGDLAKGFGGFTRVARSAVGNIARSLGRTPKKTKIAGLLVHEARVASVDRHFPRPAIERETHASERLDSGMGSNVPQKQHLKSFEDRAIGVPGARIGRKIGGAVGAHRGRAAGRFLQQHGIKATIHTSIAKPDVQGSDLPPHLERVGREHGSEYGAKVGGRVGLAGGTALVGAAAAMGGARIVGAARRKRDADGKFAKIEGAYELQRLNRVRG
jgi:hypothetical protein